MSSRHDYRRRDRSWDREDRDRDRERYGPRGAAPRRSRSRSPPRRGERDRRGPPDRRDYHPRDREDDRRDRDRDRRDDRRDDRRRDDRDRRDNDRDPRREHPPPPRQDGDRERERRDKDRDGRPAEHPSSHDSKPPPPGDRERQQSVTGTPEVESSGSRPRQESEAPTDGAEEGEAMDATNEDDAAMMAMMGLTGFGSTKGKHVEGNQEGAANIKKMRTWRQYMNRRGGFNRPLDKIK
ncbi:hypothetical protein C8Q70DRAFT_942818 [Cubamyces menziesii]|nr:hypothetical protein C8Q70DRAFT_942818 [Cubamyces menziesii]